jgi:hypothetical protein
MGGVREQDGRRRGDKEYEYLSLVEAVRVNGKNTHTTLLRLGEVSELRESSQLGRIMRALSQYASENWSTRATLAAAAPVTTFGQLTHESGRRPPFSKGMGSCRNPRLPLQEGAFPGC